MTPANTIICLSIAIIVLAIALVWCLAVLSRERDDTRSRMTTLRYEMGEERLKWMECSLKLKAIYKAAKQHRDRCTLHDVLLDHELRTPDACHSQD